MLPATKMPYAPTFNGGLALLAPQGPANGVAGVDFGRSASLPGASAGDTHPAWNAPGTRLLFQAQTPEASKGIFNYHIEGNIDIAADAVGTFTMANCILNGGDTEYFGVIQYAPGTTINIDKCDFHGCQTGAVRLSRGSITRSWFKGIGGDAIRLTGDGPKVLMGNFVQEIGLDAAWHGDVNQTDGDCSNVLSIGNRYNMPATNSIYCDGTTGSTQMLNYNTEWSGINDVTHIGDELIGGGYTLQVNAEPDEYTGSFVFLFCKATLPYSAGGAFTQYGTIYPGYEINGLTENLLFFGCTYFENGTPWMHNGEDVTGLWHYNPATASPRFLAACILLGAIDPVTHEAIWPVRTAFHGGIVNYGAPAITTPASVTVPENVALSLELTVANGEPVTRTISGGADAALFAITGSALTMVARDYEAPADSGADNTYDVIWRATDSHGNWSEQAIAVTVSDVEENLPPADPAIVAHSGGAASTYTATLTLPVPPGTQPGNIILAFVSTNANRTWTPPAGLIELADQGANPGLACFARVASTEPAGYNFVASGGGNPVGCMVAISNASLALPGAIATLAGPGALSMPGVTLAEAGVLLAAVASHQTGSQATHAAPSGMALLRTVAFNQARISLFGAVQPSGATGAKVSTLAGGSTTNAGLQVAAI